MPRQTNTARAALAPPGRSRDAVRPAAELCAARRGRKPSPPLADAASQRSNAEVRPSRGRRAAPFAHRGVGVKHEATGPAAPHAGDGWIYAGFWIRVWASVIDSALLLLIVFPLLSLIPSATRTRPAAGALFDAAGRINLDAFGPVIPGPLHIILFWVLPGVAVVAFWLARRATPGKMAIRARVVDAETGQRLRPGQSVVRYLGYYVSTLPLGLGLICVGIDARKQGWHDKLAHSVVVRRPRTVAPVRFATSTPDTPNTTGWNNE